MTTPAWSPRCDRGACTPAGCRGTTRRPRGRPGDPAGDVGLHRAPRRVPGLDPAGAQPAQRARTWSRGTPTSATWPTSRRPAFRPCRARFFAPGETVRFPSGRGGGQAGGRRGIGWCATVHRCRSGARARAGTAGRRAHRAGAALRSRGSRTARPRWCSSAAGSRTRSPRGRCCRRRANCAALDESGTYAEETLRPADPDFELWDVGHAALAAAAATARTSTSASCCTPASTSSAGRTIRGCWNWNSSSRRWAGANSTRPTARPAAARVRARRRVSPRAARARAPAMGRIDAHSAAVAAVQAAAPATCTATSAAGTPVKNCTVPTMPCAQTSTSSTTSRSVTGRGARTASSAKPRPTSSARYADQQRRVQVAPAW